METQRSTTGALLRVYRAAGTLEYGSFALEPPTAEEVARRAAVKQYRKTWKLFFDHSPGGPGSFDVTELRIVASESVGYCHALVRVSGAKVRVTIGLRKERGQWLIAHEHHSYPQ